MSGLTGDAAIMRAQVWTHCSTAGLQNAVGSGGAAVDCERSRAQAWVLSSRPFFHMSKNCWVGRESTITHLDRNSSDALRQALTCGASRGSWAEPSPDLEPALHRGPPPGHQRELPAPQLHVYYLH